MKRALLAALLVAGAIVSVSTLPACNKLQAAAAQDPLKCERDPKCEKKRGRTADCSRQCNDDPACMDRCEQVQQSNGSLGH